MRIAYIVPYVPNQIKTRPYNLIAHLSDLGHEVDVFTIGSNEKDFLDAQALRSKCRDVFYYHQPVWRSLVNSLAAIPSHRPLQSVYSWNPEFARQLVPLFGGANHRSTYDIVHVEHLRGSEYGVLLKSKYPDLPLVWDSVDCISHLFKQASGQSHSFFGKIVTRFELKRTQITEGKLLGCFDHVLVTSSVDKEALLGLPSHGMTPAPISVLANGVDQGYFRPNADVQRDPEMLVFSGKMSYHANISMVKYLVAELMPRIWAKCPSARLVIVGKDPPSDIKDFQKNPLITVTGTVDDIRPFLWRATVSVVPLLYGAGIQNKILEAMATGTPVVTTLQALSALGAKPGREILIADTAESFSSEVLRLIGNNSLCKEIGSAGLNYVQKNHAWKNIALNLVDIYKQISTSPSQVL